MQILLNCINRIVTMPSLPLSAEMALDIADVILTFLFALATIVLTGYVAWKQRQIDTKRAKLDIYDKRFVIFLTFKELFEDIEKAAMTYDMRILRFQRETLETNFLFNKDIENFREDVLNQAMKLSKAHAMIVDRTGAKHADEEFINATKTKESLILWFSKQHDDLKKIFAAYLTVENIDHEAYKPYYRKLL